MIYIHFFISDFEIVMDGQDFSNDFNDESDFEEIPGKEVEVNSQIEVFSKASSNNKQPKTMKGQWIVILEKLKKCQQCNIFLLNSNQFVKHQKQHYEQSREIEKSLAVKDNKFRCDFCKNGFQNVTLLREHIKALHMKAFYEDHNKSIGIQSTSYQSNESHIPRYKCDHCSEIFLDKITQNSHNCNKANTVESSEETTIIEKAQKHVTAKENKCSKCDKTFLYKHTLKRHFDVIHNGIRFKCSRCEKTFSQKKDLKIHVEVIHESIRHKNHKCKNCAKEFQHKRHLNEHIQTIHVGIRFKCKRCDKELHNKRSLSNHIQGVHEGIRHKCNKCEKDFSLKKNLDVHIQTNHEGKKFKCNKCEKEFSFKKDLTSHIQAIHEDIRHKCKECIKEFMNKENLTIHIQNIHKGERKMYKCQKCGKGFRRRGSLRNHLINIHEGQKYKCEKCKKEFSQRSHLISHIKTKHKELSLKCNSCEKVFFSKMFLERHILKFHKSN